MRFALLLAMVAGLSSAQEKAQAPKPDKSSYETAIIPVKTLTGDSFHRLAGMLNIFGEKYAADEKLRTIVVYAPREVIAHMRKVVEAMDRPGSEAAIGRNIEMTLTYLKCNSKPSPDIKPLPADLESVAKQLRASALCSEVYLWEVVPLRLQEGRTTEQDMRLPGGMTDQGMSFASTQIRMQPETVTRKETGRYLRLSQVRIYLRYHSAQGYETSLNTAGEFKEGQKTVIGKTSGPGAEGPVFFVIELKVLD